MELYELYQDEAGKRDAQVLREKLAREPKKKGMPGVVAAAKLAEAVVPKAPETGKLGPGHI